MISKFHSLLILLIIILVPACNTEKETSPAKKLSEPEGAKNVILITIDTCRADRLQSYGNKNIQTPAETALARVGTRFTKAFTPVPITLPSHASIMTGNYPPLHGVRDNGMFSLNDSALTLAEILKASGYNTGAFIGAFVLDSQFGLNQGFDVYDDDPAKMGRTEGYLFAERNAESVAGSALNWIKEVKSNSAPFFAWLHFFDPHKEYSPPMPFSEAYSNNLYDGEIAYVDSVIGQFLDVLNKENLLNNALIVLTADHGESLGEHGEETHGLFLYDATVHVPLIMAMDGVIPAGTVVHSQVSTIDIMPTVIDLLNLPAVDTNGTSLKPIMKGEKVSSNTPLYMESYMPKSTYNWKPVRAIRTNSWKYISAEEDELYLVETDFWETDNIIAENPDIAEKLELMLEKMTATFPKEKELTPIKGEAEEKLRSLGYLGGTRKSGQLSKFSRKEMLEIMSRIILANNMAKGNKKAEAISELKSVLAVDPENTDAQRLLGQTLLDVGKYKEAEKNLTRAIEISAVFDPMLYINLAQSLEAQNKLDKAMKQIEIVTDRSENIAEACWIGGRISLKLGKVFAAEHLLSKAVNLKADLYDARLLLGKLYLDNGEYDKAISHFGIIIEKLGSNVDFPEILSEAYRGAGVVQLNSDKEDEAEYFFDQALTIAPLNTSALLELGKLYYDNNEEKKIIPYLEKYIKIAPDKKTPDFQEAEKLLKKLTAK